MEELREKIAIKYCGAQDIDFYTPYGQKIGYEFADQILALIKEASWIDPKDFEEVASEYCRDQGWREPA